MYIEDTKRRKGRTFRMLLRALLSASEGNKVFVYAHSKNYARDLCFIAEDMARDYINRGSPFSLKFENGGQINFDVFKGDTNCKGGKGLDVFIDHHV